MNAVPTLHSRVLGNGDIPAVLLHGFTRDGRMWEPLLPSWPMLRACLVDLPGHGQSPPAQGGFDDVVDQVARVTRHHFGPRRGVVLGYSMGARVALRLAQRFPGLCGALLLDGVSPGPASDAERAARRAEDETRARMLETRGLADFLRSWEDLPLFAGVRALPPEQQQHLRSQRMQQSASGLASALRALSPAAMDFVDINQIASKSLVFMVTGESDAKFCEIARNAAALSARVRHVTVPGGHASHLEHPGAYAQAIRHILQTLPNNWDANANGATQGSPP